MALAILLDPMICAAIGNGVSDGLPYLIALLVGLGRIWYLLQRLLLSGAGVADVVWVWVMVGLRG
jgi:hypothetical protein